MLNRDTKTNSTANIITKTTVIAPEKNNAATVASDTKKQTPPSAQEQKLLSLESETVTMILHLRSSDKKAEHEFWSSLYSHIPTKFKPCMSLQDEKEWHITFIKRALSLSEARIHAIAIDLTPSAIVCEVLTKHAGYEPFYFELAIKNMLPHSFAALLESIQTDKLGKEKITKYLNDDLNYRDIKLFILALAEYQSGENGITALYCFDLYARLTKTTLFEILYPSYPYNALNEKSLNIMGSFIAKMNACQATDTETLATKKWISKVVQDHFLKVLKPLKYEPTDVKNSPACQQSECKTVNLNSTQNSLDYQQLIKQFAKNPQGQTILEPEGDDSKTIAAQINAGEWIKLNFGDTEAKRNDFQRNLFKALRLNNNFLPRLATATFLSHLLIEFRKDEKDDHAFPILRQHPCDANGNCCGETFDFGLIDSTTGVIIKDFQDRIKKLEPADRYYFTVNFSKKREWALMYDLVCEKGISIIPRPMTLCRIQELLKEFITHRIDWVRVKENMQKIHENFFYYDPDYPNKADADAYKDYALKAIKKLYGPYEAAARMFLSQFILMTSSDREWLKSAREDKDRGSSILLSNLFILSQDEMPSVALSTDYDKSNHKSPLVCLVIPTLNLLTQIHLSLFGNNATKPCYTIGPVITEFTLVCGKTNQQPVELFHPDVKNSNLTSELSVHHSTLQWHDLFHLARNSLTRCNVLLNHVREFFITNQGFNIPRLRYDLSDLHLRFNMEKYWHHSNLPFSPSLFCYKYFQEIIPGHLNRTLEHKALLLFCDMIINSKQWESLLQKEEFERLKKSFVTRENNFITIFSQLESIIQKHPNQPVNFYILAVCLSKDNVTKESAVELLNLMQTYNVLTKMIVWNQDDKMCLSKQFQPQINNHWHPVLIPLREFGSQLFTQLIDSISIGAKNGVAEAKQLASNPVFEALTQTNLKTTPAATPQFSRKP